MNISNELFGSINEGRKCINRTLVDEKSHRTKNIKKYINKTVDHKLKAKTPAKTRNKVKNNSIINNKIKDIINKDKENKKPNPLKNNKNINNINNINNISKKNLNNDNSIVIGNILKNKIDINLNNISQRLFSKETISSKNKIKKNCIYTPKRKTNIKKIEIKKRSKTCQKNSKKIIRYFLTSQNSESRFYTTKSISPNNFNYKKKNQKRNSINSKINYAFENLQNCNNIYKLSTFHEEENNDNKENKNIVNNNALCTSNNNHGNANNNINIIQNKEKNKTKGGLISKLINSNKQYENNKSIHDFLYHNINSPLSLEIIISESKGIVNTKCPLGHLKKYKFSEFFDKFRAIPDLNVSLSCFICKKHNNLNNFFCGKCYNFLCHICQKNHEYDFGHQIISIQNINTYCSLHNKKYIVFCFDCNKNCCESCHSIETKYHKFKSFQDILIDFKKEEKSISYIKNEIQNQLKIINEFKNRYKEDLKSIENSDLIERYFDEYTSYFRNILKLKEKLISKYSYNSNNYYNIMNVINLSLPVFYNYKTETLFKLSASNDLYDKYITINKIINFINYNSIKIFEGHQNQNKSILNKKKSKIYRTIKPSKIIDINNIDIKKGNTSNDINNDKYPKQILDLKYNGYFILLKDKSFDLYDKDLNLIKNFNLTKKFGDSYNEIAIGAHLLDSKNVAFYNYKKILIIRFSYDFLNYEIINEYDLKINTNNINIRFNNFGFEDEYEDKKSNSFINKIIDINKNEILSFGIRFGDKYICSIWNKNKAYDNQIVDINSDIKYFIYPIYSVLKHNETKFAILENDGNHYNVRIYEYESKYKEESLNLSNKKNKNNSINDNKEINLEKIKNVSNNKKSQNNSLNLSPSLEKDLKMPILKDIKEGKENLEININENILKKNEISKDINNKKENYKINKNRYENDDEDSEENIDQILEEIKINTQKREEEYLKAQIIQNNNPNSFKIEKNDKIKNKTQFNEIFNLKYILFKTEESSAEEIIQQIVLIKINKKLFGFLDMENFVIIDFETCEVVSKIAYGFNKLIYIDKTPNNNLLFKENNKIISYCLKDNDLIRINLPVFEYNKNDKNVSSWFLISGSIEFINKAKIIDDKFMISLFELRMEKWNLNNNLK